MFRVLHKNLQHHIRIRELSTIDVSNVCVVVVPLLQYQNPHLKSISSNISKSKTPSSITVDYLINSCGLPPETALSASKKINLSSKEKADSVLTFFQNHGLTKTQITHLISKRPRLLILDPNKILKPKMEFLDDLGFSDTNLVKLLTYDSTLLTRSLQNCIIPTFNFLKSFLCTNDEILTAFKKTTWGFQNLENAIRPNITILRDLGVSERSISKILVSQPMTLMQNAVRFKETVEMVKKMGFDLSGPMFVHALRTMGRVSKLKWEEKLAVYHSFGLSEDDIISLFKKQPFSMIMSKEKIHRGFEFFMEKLKWKPKDIYLHPHVLMLSLEKRIVPRCAVLEILNSKGMIRRKLKVTSVLTLSEKDFLAKYVTKYHEIIPEVVEAYKGGIEFVGFEERRMGWGGFKVL